MRCAHQRLVTGGTQLVASCRGAAVLPHERRWQRPSGAAVPHDRGLTLVGDPDRRDRLAVELRDHLDERVQSGAPDLVGSCSTRARAREVLRELTRGDRARPAEIVDGDGAHARGARVDRQDHSHSRRRSQLPWPFGPPQGRMCGCESGSSQAAATVRASTR